MCFKDFLPRILATEICCICHATIRIARPAVVASAVYSFYDKIMMKVAGVAQNPIEPQQSIGSSRIATSVFVEINKTGKAHHHSIKLFPFTEFQAANFKSGPVWICCPASLSFKDLYELEEIAELHRRQVKSLAKSVAVAAEVLAQGILQARQAAPEAPRSVYARTGISRK